MAGLDTPHIPASQQFAAVATLRWQLLRNAFRRKGGKGELIANILAYPIASALVLLPILGSGFGAFFVVDNGKIGGLSGIFWAVFLLQLVVSVNIAPPNLSFDPGVLLRFPLSFARYLLIRLVLGVFAASTVVGTLCLLAAALGASLAQPSLAPVAFSAALFLTITNLLLIRTVFAWVDRWLSTRRAREAMTGIFVVFGIGCQYLNLTYNTGRHGADPTAKLAAARHFYHIGEPILRLLPPGLAAGSIQSVARGHAGVALAQLAGVLLFATLFLAIFGWRMFREYRGENLSEATASPQTPPRSRPETLNVEPRSFGLPPIIAACLTKEFLYVRRNVSQFYALLVPLVMVFIIAGRFGSMSRSGMVLPCAVAYAFFSIAALSYNIFGLDANGVQTYLLAPVALRTVIIAKNIFTFLVAAVQFVLLYLVITYLYGAPALGLALSTLFWLALAVFLNTHLGNRRSITAPKKMDPGKLARRNASQLSAFMSLGLVLLLAGVGFGLILLARYLRLPWLPVPVLAVCALGGGAVYLSGLNRVESLVARHKETLIEELCKGS